MAIQKAHRGQRDEDSKDIEALENQKEESRQLFSRSNSINSQTAICSVEKEPGRPLYPRDIRGKHVLSESNNMNCIPITIALLQRN